MNDIAMRLRRLLGATLAACFLAAPGATMAAGSPQERFDEARDAFEKGDFRRALYLGEAMLADRLLSPQLFQLLGNSRYRQGDIGRASLWYERAALFPPPSAEVRQNLAHVRDRAGSFAFAVHPVRTRLSTWLGRSGWLWLMSSFGWLAAFALVTGITFSRSSALRAGFIGVAALASVVAGISALGWRWHPSYESIRDRAVVVAKDARAYTGASSTSGSVVSLPPGSQVRRIEERGAWCYVEIPAGEDMRRGWVQSEALTAFWPFDPGYLD